jgi:ribosomal protein L11 methyltransferase
LSSVIGWKSGSKAGSPSRLVRFIIAPPWSELGDVHDRLVIRIEPGMAFGTGTHETTRLCLDAIQKHYTGGSFLDVGTGTGILAIAAAKLVSEARIEACDTDETAVAIARENAELNAVAGTDQLLDRLDRRFHASADSRLCEPHSRRYRVTDARSRSA